MKLKAKNKDATSQNILLKMIDAEDNALLNKVSKKTITEGMCLEAVRKNGNTLKYVPKEMLTGEIIKESICSGVLESSEYIDYDDLNFEKVEELMNIYNDKFIKDTSIELEFFENAINYLLEQGVSLGNIIRSSLDKNTLLNRLFVGFADLIYMDKLDKALECFEKDNEKEKEFNHENIGILMFSLFEKYSIARYNDSLKGITFNSYRNEFKDGLIKIVNNERLLNDRRIMEFILNILYSRGEFSALIGDNRTYNVVNIMRNHTFTNYISTKVDFTPLVLYTCPMVLTYQAFKKHLDEGRVIFKDFENVDKIVDYYKKNPQILEKSFHELINELGTGKSNHQDLLIMVQDSVNLNNKNQIVLDIQTSSSLIIPLLLENKEMLNIINDLDSSIINSKLKNIKRFVSKNNFIFVITQYELHGEVTMEDLNKLLDLLFENRIDFFETFIDSL